MRHSGNTDVGLGVTRHRPVDFITVLSNLKVYQMKCYNITVFLGGRYILLRTSETCDKSALGEP